jgi:excisionase family DNA binding protein
MEALKMLQRTTPCDISTYWLKNELQTGSLTSEKEWLTTEEAADYLRISVKSLLNMCSNGKVSYYKWQRRNRYKMTELRELLLKERRGSNGY